jgi:hypothetical protein
MLKHRLSWAAAIAVCGLAVAAVTLLRPRGAEAQAQYPIMDSIASKIINKYQSSTCEQLWVKKDQHAPPSLEEQRAIGILRNDPQMRAAFINQIAPPIANKMFDCGMIP